VKTQYKQPKDDRVQNGTIWMGGKIEMRSSEDHGWNFLKIKSKYNKIDWM